jgi:hypothetical protein
MREGDVPYPHPQTCRDFLGAFYLMGILATAMAAVVMAQSSISCCVFWGLFGMADWGDEPTSDGGSVSATVWEGKASPTSVGDTAADTADECSSPSFKSGEVDEPVPRAAKGKGDVDVEQG